MKKDSVQISKLMSFALRHKPEELELTLDPNGWCSVDDLLNALNKKGCDINLEELVMLVDTNPKKRFALSEDKQLIRASQGHSIGIDLDYQPSKPPAILYHGTGEKAVDSILLTGIEKRDRHHVHLSADTETAEKVGARHGRAAIFIVDAGKMFADGCVFYQSANGVWLTDFVPSGYITLKP